MPDNAEPAVMVQVEGVHHQYPGAFSAALNDINLSIPAGSCFGLLGPNGAGKTTLISLMTGVLASQQGHIEIGGFSFPGDAGKIKAISGLVPQEYAFYPALTGRENLNFFAGLYQIPKAELPARLQYCVDVCGLEAVLDQRAANYSGGIKRRLNMAVGLLNKPQILYLDEPTVGIDAQSRHFILAAIEQLKISGMTVVYTSHYMEEVEQVCDEVAIIDHGQVVLQEPMNRLLQSGRQMVITPVEPPAPALLELLTKSVEAAWDGERLSLQPSARQPLSLLLAELEHLGIEVSQLHMGSHRLEETYLSVTDSELRQ